MTNGASQHVKQRDKGDGPYVPARNALERSHHSFLRPTVYDEGNAPLLRTSLSIVVLRTFQARQNFNYDSKIKCDEKKHRYSHSSGPIDSKNIRGL